MTSLMTSPGHKGDQILNSLYLHLYFYIYQKLKIPKMHMLILLAYSTSGIASGKKFVVATKWRLFLFFLE